MKGEVCLFKSIEKILDYTEEVFLGISMIFMVVICFGNVLARYAFHASWGFSEELLVILFVYNSLIGASMATRKKMHMGFTALLDKLPIQWRKVGQSIVYLSIIVMMGFLLVYGFGMCRNQYMYHLKTSALRLPEYMAGASIPISAVLIIIRTIQNWFMLICERQFD